MSDVYAMIMAGGVGTRFWPWSRRERPKQLLSVAAETSLLRRTVARALPLRGLVHIDVVTTASLYSATLAQLQEPGGDGVDRALAEGTVRVVQEPCAKNTAACIGFGLQLALSAGLSDDALLIALPADHFVGDDRAFLQDLETAVAHAAANLVVTTLGVPPTRPETGYGYLELSDASVANGAETPLHVRRFCEKPDSERAAQWLVGGKHLWNTGIFVAQLAWWRTAFEAHMPELFLGLQRFASATIGHDASEPYSEEAAEIYAQLPAKSIDYGVMEDATAVWTVAARFPWSDVGSWEAIPSVMETDAHGNVIRGDALVIDSARNVILAEGQRLVATVGLRDMVVVDTGDAVLVVPRERAQDVRKIVEALAKTREDLL